MILFKLSSQYVTKIVFYQNMSSINYVTLSCLGFCFYYFTVMHTVHVLHNIEVNTEGRTYRSPAIDSD